MLTIIVHIANEEPTVCEIENLPGPSDQSLIIYNPRRRDGKDIHYLDENVTTVIYPWHRINFVQVLPSEEMEEAIGFVRE